MEAIGIMKSEDYIEDENNHDNNDSDDIDELDNNDPNEEDVVDTVTNEYTTIDAMKSLDFLKNFMVYQSLWSFFSCVSD